MNFGYGFCVDGVYHYGYKTLSKCYQYLRKNNTLSNAWQVFKIDALGFHSIQTWERV